MIPYLIIFSIAVLGAAFYGVAGFFISALIAYVFLLMVGRVLRWIWPIPKVVLIDEENQIYFVTKNLKVQPFSRDKGFLFFKVESSGQVMCLSIFLDTHRYSLAVPLGILPAGRQQIVEMESYEGVPAITAIADYFSVRNDVWLESN